MHRAQQHAETRTRERRRRLAVEAARLMAESDCGISPRRNERRPSDLASTRMRRCRAIARSRTPCWNTSACSRATPQPQRSQRAVKPRVQAMRLLQAFEPRLVGPVLEGSADDHSAVNLHVFSDDPQAIDWHLSEHGIPFDSGSRRYRSGPDSEWEAPLVSFTADGIRFELSLFPLDGLRQRTAGPD